MQDTLVRRNCLTSRKAINILKGVTAMFVVGGGGQGGYYMFSYRTNNIFNQHIQMRNRF